MIFIGNNCASDGAVHGEADRAVIRIRSETAAAMPAINCKEAETESRRDPALRRDQLAPRVALGERRAQRAGFAFAKRAGMEPVVNAPVGA